MRRIEANPARTARIVARRPMLYRRGADAALDRAAHVHAASSLAWCGARLIVVQDDAAFLGVVDPATGVVDDVPFGDGPVRQFSVARGNKRDKPDLEASIVLGARVIAIGSGGPHAARRVVVTWTPDGAAPETRPRPHLYDALGRALLPAGTSLNIEGATVVGDEVWIANRGGDASKISDAVSPDAIARWPRAVFERIVDDDAYVPPAPAIEPVELVGGVDEVALHLAEIRVIDDRGVWFVAAAEASKHYFDDGEVRGTVLGTLDGGWTLIANEDGVCAREKIEGIAVVPGRADRLYGCVDDDDPEKPSLLLELALDGAW